MQPSVVEMIQCNYIIQFM